MPILVPEYLQRHLGELGAGDGGETFLDEFAGWRGVVMICECVKADCAEVRAAREGEPIAVGVLDWL